MSVKQISVFIENKIGSLMGVTSCLAENGINIRALCLADASDFGILRLIVNHPNRAYRALKEAGLTVRETDVLALEIDDVPGGINAGLSALEQAGINVEYVYAFIGVEKGKAVNIYKVDKMEHAARALSAANLRLLDREEVYYR